MLFQPSKMSYRRLYKRLTRHIPSNRIFTDPLHTLAFGTDASFYKLIPKIVLKTENLDEVRAALTECAADSIPVTFRAAGTSLSGQAIGDSVLILFTGPEWKRILVHPGAEKITLGPSVIAGEANRRLKPYGRKIGPDPASIESAMIGGIAANNASGMCCGVERNSYHTMDGMKLLLADGTCLDTRDRVSCESFKRSHAEMLRSLEALACEIRENKELAAKIRRKYQIKNTMGYSLNAFLDFIDPIDILIHLLIGSEGTLGFIAELTYQTIPEPSVRRTALVSFEDLQTACQAVETISEITGVHAAELMDAASLRAVQELCMQGGLRPVGEGGCAVLVEVAGECEKQVSRSSSEVERALLPYCNSGSVLFVREPHAIEAIWKVRKGLYPAVGAVRAPGSSVIIEDVGFPKTQLAHGARDLRLLLDQHGYSSAILFGHALAGNLHFVFTVDWSSGGEVERYGRFMNDLSRLLCVQYQGSLKSEHGTGRNMAPFVEREWGSEAYRVMKEVKKIFDPMGILNPGVLLNEDAEVHLKNLKTIPAADPLVDACVECGFCEPICPSRDLTLTPRQRITVYREIKKLEKSREDQSRLRRLTEIYKNKGEETCAADGLCSTRCPVKIDTGRLMKTLRANQLNLFSKKMGFLAARHYDLVLAASRGGLSVMHQLRRVISEEWLERAGVWMSRLTGGRLPPWRTFLPAPASPGALISASSAASSAVVYFPSCLTRTLGPSLWELNQKPLVQSVSSLLRMADYHEAVPQSLEGLCCGLSFESKGHVEAGLFKLHELEKKLWEVSDEGRRPVLFDTSPCFVRFRENQNLRRWKAGIYEPACFFADKLAPRLTIEKLSTPLLYHIPCSAQKAGLSDAYHRAASLLSGQPTFMGEGCCGFAGDKGLHFPELPLSAVKNFEGFDSGCQRGVSGSATCEMALSAHGRRPFSSILKVAEEQSKSKTMQ